MVDSSASPSEGAQKPKKAPSAKQIAAREAFAQRARDYKAWQESQRSGTKPPPVTAKATPPPAPSAPATSSPGGGGSSPAPAVPVPKFAWYDHVFPGLFGKKGA